MADVRRRRRRRAHRRRRRDAGGGVVLPIILCAILTPIAVIIAVTVFFRVSEVVVSGESGYPSFEIVEASGIKTGQNMFQFNKFKAIDGIFEDMPYIDEISIRRHLPDTVEIKVSRCSPAAAIKHKDHWYLMDIKGKLLENAGNIQPEGYPVIEGAEIKEPKVGKYAEFISEETKKPLFLVLNTALNNDILQHIGCIDVEKVYNIKFTYKGRFWVNIGDSEQMEKKFRFMLAVEDKLSPNDRGTIDLSDGTTAWFTPENE